MECQISVRRAVLNQMLDHAREDASYECCGLLAGRDGIITQEFPARNALASATAYEIAPQELFSLFSEMRAQNLDFLGIYHSHPNTENIPSPTDIERAYYPDAAYFIISPKLDAPKPIRAFHIRDGNVTELFLEDVL